MASRLQHKGWLLFVLIFVSLVYSNHFHNSFHFDDFHTITDNPYIRDLRNIPKFFCDARTFSILPSNQAYRPVVSTSLAIDYWLASGYHQKWFHISTFFWFLVQLVAMYALFTGILKRVRPERFNQTVALVATAWYGVHPVMAETVNYIIQRAEVYCTLGVVVALVVYARFPHLRNTQLYLLPVVGAVLSKPGALVFPLLLLICIFYFEEDANPRRITAAVARCIPAFLVSGLLAWLSSAMTPKSFLPAIVSASSYRITQPYVWARYFVALFLPIHLSADTDLQPFATWDGEAALGLLFLAAMLAVIWISTRRAILRPIAFGSAWFVVASLPTSLYPLSEVENDHRMFFPFVGLVLAVSWAVALLVDLYASRSGSKVLARVAAFAVICALCGYAYGTWQRNAVWRSEESLWRDVTGKSPKNGRGLMNYGLTQMSQGRYELALDYFQRAAKFNPSYSLLEVNLGVANGALGRAAIAEAHFRRALHLDPWDARPLYYYARWLDQNGRLAEALQMSQLAVRLNPSWIESRTLLMRLEANLPTPNADYWVNVSLERYRAGQYRESIDAACEALKLKPDSFEAYNNIAAADAALGKWVDAIAAASEALRLKPDFGLARNNLAWARQQKQRSAR